MMLVTVTWGTVRRNVTVLNNGHRAPHS